jgi:hypothetical protein
MVCAYHGYRRAQTLYSTVNNFVFNVMHNRIDSTGFNYLSVVMTWCRVAHLFPLNNILCDVKIFFLFFMCEGHVDSSSFCFATKVQLYFKNLLKMANQLYINEILLHIRSRAMPISATRLGGPVRTGYVAWLALDLLCCAVWICGTASRADQCGTTGLGPPKPAEPMAWLGVTPQGLARLLERAPITPDIVARLVQCPDC